MTGLGLNPGLLVDKPDSSWKKHEIKLKKVVELKTLSAKEVRQERSLLPLVVNATGKP